MSRTPEEVREMTSRALAKARTRQVGEVAAKTWEEAREQMELIEKTQGSSPASQRFISQCTTLAMLARAAVAPPGSGGRRG